MNKEIKEHYGWKQTRETKISEDLTLKYLGLIWCHENLINIQNTLHVLVPWENNRLKLCFLNAFWGLGNPAALIILWIIFQTECININIMLVADIESDPR